MCSNLCSVFFRACGLFCSLYFYFVECCPKCCDGREKMLQSPAGPKWHSKNSVASVGLDHQTEKARSLPQEKLKERERGREREGFLSMHIQRFNLAPGFVDTENPIIVFYANHLKRFWKPWTHRTPLHLFRKGSGSLRPLMKILQKTGGGQNYL